MKKYIPLLILLFFASSAIKAQTFSDDNFVYTAAPKKAVQSTNYSTLTKDEINQSVTFFDGLGRPVQTTAIGQGVNSSDIITPVDYDDFGRQVNDYLPYSLSNSTTTYPRIAMTSSLVTLNGVYNTPKYDNTAKPFSEKLFENSPLNRVLKQAAPGNDWAMTSGHEIKLDYKTNIATEVKLYKATATWDSGLGLYEIGFVDAGTYAAGQLFKNITYDENTTPGIKTGVEEFKNKQGQVVLKRTYESSTPHDTYYVYDNYGNLTYVIPPIVGSVIDADVLNGLCYQYKYDNRNRLVEKKLPGKQWEFIVYDKLNRPMATGPAFSPFKDDTTIGWIITKYDAFSRPIYTGWSSQTASSVTRKSLQDIQNTATTLFENKQASGTIDGIEVYYTNANEPINFKLLTVNYYDNYLFPGVQTVPSTIEGQAVLTNVKTLSTGGWTRVVTTATAISGETNTIFYDGNARPIQTYSQNYLGGHTITNMNLDFVGKTIYTVTKHKRTSGDTDMVIREDFTYSSQDRLLTHTHQIGGVTQLMAANKYDELGQLTSKKVGNSEGSPLQVIDYSYNVRGWLTEINKTSNLDQGTDPRDLFAFKINYNKIEGDPGFAKALYNGNIAETFWSSGLDGPDITRGYGYQYDQLNRLKSASFQAPRLTDNKNYFGENMDYDKNGNIIRLQREYMAGTSSNPYVGDLDNLGYFYKTNSNQLMKVTDTSNIPGGFKDDSNGSNDTVDDYDYDLNGNLIKDDNKEITNISYNHLNLPKKIIFGTKGSIEYIYNAAGVKVQKIVNETGKPTITTDYLGGFQYKDNILEFFPTAEGYVKNTASTLSYVFQYKDHLGNVRVNYTKNPSTQVLEIIDENNYYPFGLKHVSYMNLPESGNKYKYNGKELQDELGLNMYDYGARNYDPALGRWMNIDPLAEKMRRFSPYNYAMNNPVYFIDPDGMEAKATYGVDSNGYVKKLDDKKYFDKNKKEVDRLYATDKAGEKTSKSIDVEKGALASKEVKAGSDTYFMKQGEGATKLFEFFAENTKVEFGKIDENNNNTWIVTDHLKEHVPSADKLLSNLADSQEGAGFNYTYTHSHPNVPTGSARPSGFTKSDADYGGGDKGFVTSLSKEFPKESIQTKVYDARTQSYIYFNKNGYSVPVKKK